MSRTSTPWQSATREEYLAWSVSAAGQLIANARSREDAEFIVLAVNCHEDLVNTLAELTEIASELTDEGPPGEQWKSDRFEKALESARAVIHKAKENS